MGKGSWPDPGVFPKESVEKAREWARMKNEVAKIERAQEEEAFLSDPDFASYRLLNGMTGGLVGRS